MVEEIDSFFIVLNGQSFVDTMESGNVLWVHVGRREAVKVPRQLGVVPSVCVANQEPWQRNQALNGTVLQITITSNTPIIPLRPLFIYTNITASCITTAPISNTFESISD